MGVPSFKLGKRKEQQQQQQPSVGSCTSKVTKRAAGGRMSVSTLRVVFGLLLH